MESHVAETRTVEIPPVITVAELADLIGASPIEVIKELMKQGVFATINQAIDYEVAARVGPRFGLTIKLKRPEPTVQLITDYASFKQMLAQEDPAKLRPRPPVVTVMGHVDHGKTTLLDRIRRTRVAEQEAGGITQHIGAYQVEVNGQKITFIDTPGHEAFTAMRARGAQVTDIVVLVVAADDGVMPQTVEAVNHARAAGVPIVVAINKIDRPDANIERVKQQLAELGLIPEEWGGDTITVPISARTGEGVDLLLENILILAEILELKANPDRPAVGTIIEARLDKNRGPVGTVLVQNGTLRVGDIFVAGETWGKVKAMVDDRGRRLREAGPSTPAEVLGFESVPVVGDILQVVEDEDQARRIAEERQEARRAEREAIAARAITLEAVARQAQAGKPTELLVVLKADVQGSVEAVRTALERLNEKYETRIRIIHAASGTITESDVLLAAASGAIIVGFNTRLEPGARALAEAEGVEIRQYNIIYHLIEDVEKALAGLRQPVYREVVYGRAEVRQVFLIGRTGQQVAGCYVLEGKVTRGQRVRILREGKVIFDGRVTSLRRFKEDVREVAAGFECGVGIEGFNEFRPGDILEVYGQEVVA
ncbi:MAG: translation initiation factor IF-2 [Chloroflexota bacterium]